ncbi:phosphoenolpyruvate--protein phosphotransferase [Pseudohoeflea coraliihabitans]|uniref:Phosphoenolpyruvate-protein phosphotransferase n=1 Tax=Pseudohoeflea coraliihabitans TaxID=2860393 RepID=A0ABS6WL52_9HYPH|nr:phosphoenolpyruvate--protein phosphotransferase [Pseudohoeflea sp. DP4N28-3]MBW3096686.1 phosphoenolpyruvate--protein phosphotransferase [Pseudohoeflea sp. DP4N28-3]
MERSTIVRVHEGLHARPATRFVKLAKSFESTIEIRKSGKQANAKSSVKVMLLGVKENDEVTISAEGADAVEAVEMLISYLEDSAAGIDEAGGTMASDGAPSDAAPVDREAAVSVPSNAVPGAAASRGIALGPVFAHFPPKIVPAEVSLAPADRPKEKARLAQAVTTVERRLDASISDPGIADTDRQILQALRDIAGDDELKSASEAIIDGGLDAVSAVIAASTRLVDEFSKLEDAYLRARAEDLQSVARQICLALLGEEEVRLDDLAEGAILVASDIGAWDLARAPLKRLGGIVCGHGGATSHVAIIARTHGIPAVLGIGDSVEQMRNAEQIGVDGTRGLVFADPDADTRVRLEEEIAADEQERAALKAFRTAEPRRADGQLIHIAANLGSLDEIDVALEAGAMGVGLFRTELLFMRHMHLPSEDMQTETYAKLAAAFAPHPVIIRTLDVGGDKPIAGIDFVEEDNPFLGWRGIRMCLDRPDIFKPQLRALLRAAVSGNLKVMLPMVSRIEELRLTRALIDECKAELTQEGHAHSDFELGVMIETPAAVFSAPLLAREAAFFSIGTNDLTQYVMAADRLNPAVAALNDAAHPAVMSAIAQAAAAAREAGIEIGMCGEVAAREDLVPRFLEMGLTELSMSPASILSVKKQVCELLENE